jgi:putative transcriptional regulator
MAVRAWTPGEVTRNLYIGLSQAVAAGWQAGRRNEVSMTMIDVGELRAQFKIPGSGNGKPGMTNRLRLLRGDCSWSQAELARRLGVSRQTVNALERGKYHPSLPLAFKIARLFERPIEEVFHPQWEGVQAGK